MTKIEIYKDRLGSIVQGRLSGHTGFGEEGEDIVCAAVSAAVQMALLGIEKVAKTPVGYETGDGYLFFTLPDDLKDDERKNTDILLCSMAEFLKELCRQYPQNVSITELEV